MRCSERPRGPTRDFATRPSVERPPEPVRMVRIALLGSPGVSSPKTAARPPSIVARPATRSPMAQICVSTRANRRLTRAAARHHREGEQDREEPDRQTRGRLGALDVPPRALGHDLDHPLVVLVRVEGVVRALGAGGVGSPGTPARRGCRRRSGQMGPDRPPRATPAARRCRTRCRRRTPPPRSRSSHATRPRTARPAAHPRRARPPPGPRPRGMPAGSAPRRHPRATQDRAPGRPG